MDKYDFEEKYPNIKFRLNYFDEIEIKLEHEEIFDKNLFNTIIDIINDSKNAENKIRFLIYDNPLNYSDKETERVKDLFSTLKSNNLDCYFRQAGANFSFDEAMNAKKIIKEFAEKVKSQNLSPLEQILSVYLEITKKVYTETLSKNDRYLSRSIFGVLNTEFIVCVGYSELFEAIIKQINNKDIKVYQNSIRLNNSRHSDLIVYLKDKKYGIDGYYFLDPTIDRKRDLDEDNIRLNFFLTPISDMQSIATDVEVDDYTFNNYVARDDGTNLVKLEKNRVYETDEGNISIDGRNSYIGTSFIKMMLDNQIIKNTTIDLFTNKIEDKLDYLDECYKTYGEDNLKDTDFEKKMESEILYYYNKLEQLKGSNLSYSTYDQLERACLESIMYLGDTIPLKFIKNALKTYFKANNPQKNDQELNKIVNDIIDYNIERVNTVFDVGAKNCFALEAYKDEKNL